MNLSADLGEGAGPDSEILPYIDSASICCGVHAGSASITLAAVRACLRASVQIGAHPGYDDRASFGRADVELDAGELEALLRLQAGGLCAVAKVTYLKAHGALYHRCQTDARAARVLALVASDLGLGVVGQPGTPLAGECRRAGVRLHREAYADRAYGPDGRLVPRRNAQALLAPAPAAAQALRLARSGRFDTICLHGDSPDASTGARLIRRALLDAGIETAPL